MNFLDGLLIVDLSRVLAGPLCTMRLADWGARVVKIESPKGDATRRFGPPFVKGESSYFMAYNRGKESLVLDLRTEFDCEVLNRLIEKADVLVENFRDGVMDQMGLSLKRQQALNPRLVSLTISGYGTQTTRRHEGAFDLAIQAETGLMAMTGPEDQAGETCRVPFSAADVAAGMAASEAVLAALVGLERRGGAAGFCHLEVSLFDSLMSFLGFQAQATLLTGKDPKRMGHRHPNLVPYQIFETRDGALVLAIATDEAWRRFLKIDGVPADMNREEWSRNGDRVGQRHELVPAVEKVLLSKSTEEWKIALDAADIPVGRLRGVSDALEELRRRHDGFLRTAAHATLGEMAVLGRAARLNGGPGPCLSAAPVLNQHGEAILNEFANDAAERCHWRRQWSQKETLS